MACHFYAVKVGRNYIPQKKALYCLFESNFETSQIFVLKGSRPVLVKVVLFHSRGCGHPQDDAMANVFLDSKGSILGLSNEVSFVSEIYWKGG